MQRYGPWAIVTGASSGIGRAIALDVAKRGLHVAIVARTESALAELARDIAPTGAQTRVIPADLATRDGRERVVTQTADLDAGLFVAAAGFGTSGTFVDANLGAELDMLHVNCDAVVEHALTFARRFTKRGRGGIVLFGSLVGYQGCPYSATYAATKAFVQTFAEGLHVELKTAGVDVLSSAPGPVRSGFEARAGMRMQQALTPEEVASGTLDALGRRATVAPGMLSKLLTWSLAPLSRMARTRVMGRIMGQMTAHQRG